MTIESKNSRIITVGAGGKHVDQNSLAFLVAQDIAYDYGNRKRDLNIIVKKVPETGEEDDGHPIKIDPVPEPSFN